ncbi:MAG: DEAD/DEAH box helicase [Chloroflexi bacterium]|nr:DEAD/DEAH box helicase [Chloroflexota bacterium]
MTPTEIESSLSNPSDAREHAFQILQSLGRLLGEEPEDPQVLTLLIRALEHREAFEAYYPLLNALLRETGLYPYAEPNLLSSRDRLAFEFHRPAGSSDQSALVFHRVQALVYWRLVEGENIILSAPTSFGKSLIIDALIDTGKYRRIALVVPTIALIDETRKRLSRFSSDYKIVTHASQPADSSRGTVFVLTQERVIDRDDLDHLDLFVIDEFYKLSPDGKDDSRAAILNHAFYKLLKTARQFYLLGPNIRTVPTDFRERFEAGLIISDFVTVASNVRRVTGTGRSRESREAALVDLTRAVDGSTLIYCQSPASVRRVAGLMVEQKVAPTVPELVEVVEWVGANFHPEWIVARALSYGIGVHHGRLPRALAQLQVRLFNAGKLKFLVCTSTLIEGVNTAAKHVVIYDNKISRKPIDYFTYRNIQGRSGRMFRHFVGTVHLFHNPPQPDLLDVDFPVFSQTESASDGLLVQLDEEDLGSEGSQRVGRLRVQSELSMETIRANAHVEPQQQIELAGHIRLNAVELYPYLSWRGQPTNDQVYKICELLFDTLLSNVGRSAVRSDKQLAYLLTRLQEQGASGFITEQAFASGPGAPADASDRVENALEFLRNWASFYFPRALSALERIQAEVFERLGQTGGSYAAFAVRIENLMLPPALAALDEYGLPLQLVSRLQGQLPFEDDLDAVLHGLSALDIAALRLGPFETELLNEVKNSL